MPDRTAAIKDTLERYPCPGCNAQLSFVPSTQELDCAHCGTRIPIDKGRDRISEQALRAQLDQPYPIAVPVTQYIYTCNRCSASNTFSTEIPTFTCQACQFAVVNPDAFRTREVQPAGILPFVVDQAEALSTYQQWIGKGLWQPGKLKTVARADLLQGCYLPFWTFDAQTDSDWSGYAGTYYWDTEYYTDSEGKRQSRSVRKTRWTYRSGNYRHLFDDVLVGGSNLLSQEECAAVFPFDLSAAVNFSAAFLAGWIADVADIGLADGYSLAEAIMKQDIYEACAHLCRDDEYRDLEVETRYTDQTYKHLLLPLWICSYLYKQKTYHFLINGQTGKIYGKKPVSAGKVVLAILLVLLVILLIVLIANSGGE